MLSRSNDSSSRFLSSARPSHHVPLYAGFMLPCPHQHRKVCLYSFIFKGKITAVIPRAAGCSCVGLFRELDPFGFHSSGVIYRVFHDFRA
jgi:hypothetical protein